MIFWPRFLRGEGMEPMTISFDEQLENLKQRLLWGSRGTGCFFPPAQCEEVAQLILIVLQEHRDRLIEMQIREANHENSL